MRRVKIKMKEETIEVIFSIEDEKIKSKITLHSDGVISITQDDTSRIYIYPAEIKTIKELTKSA